MDDQLTLFDLDPADVLPPQIAHMRRRHGAANEHCCGTCANLVRVRSGGSTYAKCYEYGISASDATDWRAKWPACGLWQEAKQ